MFYGVGTFEEEVIYGFYQSGIVEFVCFSDVELFEFFEVAEDDESGTPTKFRIVLNIEGVSFYIYCLSDVIFCIFFT